MTEKTCPTCGTKTLAPVCPNCRMTIIQTVERYTGGRGFVTTEQAIQTDGTMQSPTGFWVTGIPEPKLGSREPKGLPAWQTKVEKGARMARLSAGEMGAFRPCSVILQFSTDDTHRVDLLCRSTLDALVHGRLLFDDSAVVDLIATRRPVSMSPTGEPGVHVVAIPGEILPSASMDFLRGELGGVTKFIKAIPRTYPDKKGGGDRSPEWLAAVKKAFADTPIPKVATLVMEFNLLRWLEPDGTGREERIDAPIVNGRDLDRLSKGVGIALSTDVCDFAASKRMSETANGLVSVSEGPGLTAGVLGRLFAR